MNNQILIRITGKNEVDVALHICLGDSLRNSVQTNSRLKSSESGPLNELVTCEKCGKN